MRSGLRSFRGTFSLLPRESPYFKAAQYGRTPGACLQPCAGWEVLKGEGDRVDHP